MYIDINVPCSRKALFDVPHKKDPMTAKEIIRELPEFAKLFDGNGKENTLLFYWKLNKQRGVYEFLDADAEEEVAELMQVQLYDEQKDTDDALDVRPLTEEDIKVFRDHLEDIRAGLTVLNGGSSSDTP